MSQFKYKQAIIIRKDLKMPTGKSVGQGAHVAVPAAVDVYKKSPEIYEAWMKEGQAKIVLRVESLEELLALKKKADEKGLPTAIISDFGLTVLEPGTTTAIAIGPATVESVNEITRDLKLLS